MSRRDNAMIGLYNFVSTRKPWVTIPASIALLYFSYRPVVYGFVWVAYWLLTSVFHLPKDGDYSGILVAAGVMWVATMIASINALVYLYDTMQHLLYRPYIAAWVRKYNH